MYTFCIYFSFTECRGLRLGELVKHSSKQTKAVSLGLSAITSGLIQINPQLNKHVKIYKLYLPFFNPLLMCDLCSATPSRPQIHCPCWSHCNSPSQVVSEAGSCRATISTAN